MQYLDDQSFPVSASLSCLRTRLLVPAESDHGNAAVSFEGHGQVVAPARRSSWLSRMQRLAVDRLSQLEIDEQW